jgi:hypothetical protein
VTGGTISTITNPVTVAGAVTSIVSQATAANLNATVTGNVGGFTFSLQVNPAISTSAYVAGNVVGGIQILTGAMRTVGGTGILESLVILDRTPASAPMDIFIFSSNPAAATTTDHTTFVWSTDALKVIARISILTTDYVTVAAEAVAVKSGLGIAVKSVGTANLYAVAITSATPTYGAPPNSLQFTWGILQD